MKTTRALVLAATTVLTACASAPPAAVDSVTGKLLPTRAAGWAQPLGAVIRVHFAVGADRRVVRLEDRTLRDSTLRDVQTLVGRLRSSRGDTLWLSVSSIQSSDGRRSNLYRRGRFWTARVERDDDTKIELVSAHPDRAERVLGGAVLGVAAGSLVLSAYCSLHRC